ncbi:MAG: DUF1416 domain-containing protein [bacterium]
MSCGAPTGGAAVDGADLANETVIEGVVVRGGSPVGGAYVRLLDATGEFTAEVPTGDGGEFRFFAAPGEWTVRALAAGAHPVDRAVVASRGAVSTVEVPV